MLALIAAPPSMIRVHDHNANEVIMTSYPDKEAATSAAGSKRQRCDDDDLASWAEALDFDAGGHAPGACSSESERLELPEAQQNVAESHHQSAEMGQLVNDLFGPPLVASAQQPGGIAGYTPGSIQPLSSLRGRSTSASAVPPQQSGGLTPPAAPPRARSMSMSSSFVLQQHQASPAPSLPVASSTANTTQKHEKHEDGFTQKGFRRSHIQHNYHDYAMLTAQEIASLPLEQQLRVGKRGIPASFPMLLHKMLESAESQGYADVVSWQPHGRSFRVHDQDRFIKEVMPRFFKQTRFGSFQRQLNLYGFLRCIRRGPDYTSYYHELCLRGRPVLCAKIQRTRVKGSSVRPVASPDSEPDFYRMPAVQPIHEAPTGMAVSMAAVPPMNLLQLSAPSVLPQRIATQAQLSMMFPAMAAATAAGAQLPMLPGVMPPFLPVAPTSAMPPVSANAAPVAASTETAAPLRSPPTLPTIAEIPSPPAQPVSTTTAHLVAAAPASLGRAASASTPSMAPLSANVATAAAGVSSAPKLGTLRASVAGSGYTASEIPAAARLTSVSQPLPMKPRLGLSPLPSNPLSRPANMTYFRHDDAPGTSVSQQPPPQLPQLPQPQPVLLSDNSIVSAKQRSVAAQRTFFPRQQMLLPQSIVPMAVDTDSKPKALFGFEGLLSHQDDNTKPAADPPVKQEVLKLSIRQHQDMLAFLADVELSSNGSGSTSSEQQPDDFDQIFS